MGIENWCKSKKCEYYIEWSYYVDNKIGEVPCFSCKLQGQWHQIEDIAENCPHKQHDIFPELLQVANEMKD